MGEVTSIRTARKRSVTVRSETHIDKLLGEARLKLVETGRRNRLIHAPRGSRRSRAISIVSSDADQTFTTLVRRSKSFLDRRRGRSSAGLGLPEDTRLVMPKASYQTGLQTSVASELLHKRLHAIHRDAKTAEEERGVNVLFLALGFLRWYESEISDLPS